MKSAAEGLKLARMFEEGEGQLADQAPDVYELVIEKFPNSREAELARIALAVLRPGSTCLSESGLARDFKDSPEPIRILSQIIEGLYAGLDDDNDEGRRKLKFYYERLATITDQSARSDVLAATYRCRSCNNLHCMMHRYQLSGMAGMSRENVGAMLAVICDYCGDTKHVHEATINRRDIGLIVRMFWDY